ncbi:MAG: hypothetical protein EBZ89_00155 [Chloroflexi bacterium]|nr:hypothetical protein [Chloroflexota bacterium]
MGQQDAMFTRNRPSLEAPRRVHARIGMPFSSRSHASEAVGLSASGVPINTIVTDGALPRQRRASPSGTRRPPVTPRDDGILGSLLRSFRALGTPSHTSRRPAIADLDESPRTRGADIRRTPIEAHSTFNSDTNASIAETGAPFNPFTGGLIGGWRSRWATNAEDHYAQKAAPDGPMLVLIIVMLAVGLCTMQSASMVTAYTQYRDQLHFLWRQLGSASIGIVALVALCAIDYRVLPKFAAVAALLLFVMLAATGAAVYLVAGAPWLVFYAMTALGCGLVALLTWIEPYRMARFTTFIDPFNDPQKDGYHVVQSLLALGSGGLKGVGFGMGRQKFLFLPYPNTDSIFAVIGEEVGLIGTLLTLAMFAGFLYRGMLIAGRAQDTLGRYVATGLTVGIAFQGFLNMAVMTSSVPFTGITLPFFSYGGSSLITTLASCGVLLSISTYSTTTVPTARNAVGWWRRSVAAMRQTA